jgi:hypothetical protein
MGEAKRRGSFTERKQQAIQKQAEKPEPSPRKQTPINTLLALLIYQLAEEVPNGP